MEKSQKFLERRRFLMVVPLLTFPFIMMAFWVLGGGKGPMSQSTLPQVGLNLNVPGANLSKDAGDMDKLSVYEQARLDSQKYEQDKRLDPYFQFATLEEANKKKEEKEDKILNNDPASSRVKQMPIGDQPDENEKAVREKLAELTRHLEQGAPGGTHTAGSTKFPETTNKHTGQLTDVDRLEALMENLHERTEDDADMKQISQVLDKILDVQHPERVTARLKELRDNEITSAHAVLPAGEAEYRTLLGGYDMIDLTDSVLHVRFYGEKNAFYALDEFVYERNASNALEAVVQGEQVIVSDGTIKMRLLSDLAVEGVTIPSNTFVFGSCSMNGERLNVEVKTISHGTRIFQVSLKVYDLDGQEGLFVPGALNRDAAKTASGQMIQDVQLYSMDPSLGAQAASAGVQAARGLLSKKAKLIKFTIKSGYRVLLRDSRSQASHHLIR